jgi:hypothetical protein
MSDALSASLNHGAALWASAMARACWQGGIALALAWAVCRAWPVLPPRARCWLWRLAYLKLLVALLWATPVDLPLLPAPPAPPAAAPMARLATEAGAAKQRGRSPRAMEARTQLSRTEEGSVAEGRLRDFVAVVSTARPRSAGGLMFLWLLGVVGCGARFAREWRETQLLLAG